MSAAVHIRVATAADVPAIAAVYLASWRCAYRGIIPDAYLDALTVEGRTRQIGNVLREDPSPFWVAESQGQIRGHISFGRSRDPDATARTAEVRSVYVDPQQWGTGTGRALWLAARGWCRGHGFEAVTLWVLAENRRAIRFYEAAGFVAEPGTLKDLNRGGRTLQEVRYVTSLAG